jgi:PPOX class probable F420-dependent enzyme
MLDLNNPKHVHIDQRLREEPIIWLSTLRADDRPHLVPVWFLWDGSTMLIFSQPDNQKIRNLRQNANVALALEATNEGEDVAIFEGTAALLDEKTADLITSAYIEKYAKMMEAMGWQVEGMAASYSQPIHVTPTKVITW